MLVPETGIEKCIQGLVRRGIVDSYDDTYLKVTPKHKFAGFAHAKNANLTRSSPDSAV